MWMGARQSMGEEEIGREGVNHEGGGDKEGVTREGGGVER